MSHAFPAPVSVRTLEHELAGLLDAIRLSPRQAAAVAARLGFAGEPATTLERAAKPSGYTRERVRQLESQGRAELSRRRPPRSVVRALAVLEQAAPETRGYAAELLCTAGVAARPFDPSGVLLAADAFGLQTQVRVHDRVVEQAGSDVLRTLVVTARSQAARRGAASAVEVGFELGLDGGRVRRLLDLVPEVRWLDDRRSWLAVAVPDVTRRVEGILRKMLAVRPSVTLDEAEEGLRRAFRPVAVPRRVLLRLLADIPWVEGRTELRASIPLSRSRELSPAEERLVDVLERAGGEARFTELVALGTPSLNRNTIAYYLRHSPVVAPAGRRGLYRLCGHRAATASSSVS
jgi:hypothetical protein